MTNYKGEEAETDDEGEPLVDKAKEQNMDEPLFKVNMVIEENEEEQVELSESEVLLT